MALYSGDPDRRTLYFSFLFTPLTLLVMLILVCTLSEAMMNGQWRSRMVYLAALALGTLLLYFGMLLAAPGAMDLYRCLLVVTLLSLIFVAIYAFRANLRNIFITIGLFLTAMLFVPTTDYIFNSILKEHQQNRILSFLGLVSDPLGTDYNVNQAKIAIGSGGWIGKGFLQGTQIKYGFVPEKHTDFIFCTIGEVGISGRYASADALLPVDIPVDAYGRTAGGAFRTDLLLLRCGIPAFSSAR